MDAGRVWTPDARFRSGLFNEEGMRFSTGTGVEVGTPVGPVRLTVGYKLNPSLLDERDPQAVLVALEAGSPVGDVPVDAIRRWHVHLAIGHAF
jgi:outer membrane protein assembly factor BamA